MRTQIVDEIDFSYQNSKLVPFGSNDQLNVSDFCRVKKSINNNNNNNSSSSSNISVASNNNIGFESSFVEDGRPRKWPLRSKEEKSNGYFFWNKNYKKSENCKFTFRRKKNSTVSCYIRRLSAFFVTHETE